MEEAQIISEHVGSMSVAIVRADRLESMFGGGLLVVRDKRYFPAG